MTTCYNGIVAYINVVKVKYDNLTLEELIDKFKNKDLGYIFYSLSFITKWRARANKEKEWEEILDNDKKEAVRRLLIKCERRRWL